MIVLADEGKDHLSIVRRLGTAPTSYYSNNHSLPLVREVVFEDLIFGLFPLCGRSCDALYGSWAKNSVGDILNIILQSLEVVFPLVPASRLN